MYQTIGRFKFETRSNWTDCNLPKIYDNPGLTPSYSLIRICSNKFQISILPICPSLLVPLMPCSVDDLKSVRFIFTGGAPTNESFISILLNRIPPGSLDVYNIYGMTEISGFISVTKVSTGNKDDCGQAVGKVLPFLITKVSDYRL